MAPLLCPSPIILDQSFPRDEKQLYLVADALGKLAEFVQEGKMGLILTQTLRDFISDIDWNRPPRPQGILREIYTLFSHWFLQQHKGLISIDVSQVQTYKVHAVPQGCEDVGLIEIWSDELGRILFVHDDSCEGGEFFIGIACASGFAGEEVSEYNNVPEDNRVFPLIGLSNIDTLSDAYDWDIPNDIHQKHVTVADAKKNLVMLGGVCEHSPSRGSHYKVKFKGGTRSWVLDPNNDPIPDRYLHELVAITGKPFNFIKSVLISGSIPKAYLKIEKSKLLSHSLGS